MNHYYFRYKRIVFIYTGILVLIIFSISNSFSFQQNSNSDNSGVTKATQQRDIENHIEIYSFWATILGVLVAIVTLIAGFNVIIQYIETRKMREQLEKEIVGLKEKYNLKTPEDILKAAKEEYEPLIHNLRQSVERVHGELLKVIDLNQIEFTNFKEKNTQNFEQLGKEISNIPSKENILFEVNKNFKPPIDLQKIILSRVLSAFLNIKSLSDFERSSISNLLDERSKSNDSK